MYRAVHAHSEVRNHATPRTPRLSNHDDAGAGAAAVTDPGMKCMSVVEDASKIAFACYNEEQNEIILEESNANGYDSERVIEGFLAVARPTLILVGSKVVANAPLLQVLTRPPPSALDENNNESDPSNGGNGDNSIATTNRPSSSLHAARTTPYKILKSGAFDLQKCKGLILQKLRVLSLLHRQRRAGADCIAGANNRADRCFPQSTERPVFSPSSYHSMASVVDFDSKVQVQALGSLLSFLQGTIFQLEQGGLITVSNIFHSQSSMFMRLDSNTISALRIFATEHHPLVTKGYGNAKEGFSLFSLLDKTQSWGGRQLLRDWMLKPLLDPVKISQRQDGIELFLRPDVAPMVGNLLTLLNRVGAIDKIFTRMQKCHTQPNDFLVMTRSVSAIIAIWNVLENDLLVKLHILRDRGHPKTADDDEDNTAQRERKKAESYISHVEQITTRVETSVLADLQERITSVVDEEALMQTHSVVTVRAGYHDKLDEAKEKFEALEETLQAVGQDVAAKHPYLPASKVIFVPQIGFLIGFATDSGFDFSGLPVDFYHIFNENDEVYFKNEETNYLDATMGDMYAFIRDTESLIVSELEEDILDCEPALREAFSSMAELDCILSLTQCATDLNFVRPEVVSSAESCVYIQQGKHPLQELILEGDFVPNDVVIDPDKRVNIVTGPNYSGKSCYARQVGVLVYMAHIGSFLPCQKAKISVTDQIFARMSTVETCAVPQSSFQLDLTQMAAILRQGTPRSLVLIDEFGKGTSPASGIAVLTAALHKLSAMACKVVCTTHFLEIFSLGLVQEGVDGITALQMAVQLPRTQNDDALPLFRLEAGVASSSAGLVCAKTAGVDRSVISRAADILDAMREGKQVAPLQELIEPSAKFSHAGLDVLRDFLQVKSWANVNDDDLRNFLRKVAQTSF